MRVFRGISLGAAPLLSRHRVKWTLRKAESRLRRATRVYLFLARGIFEVGSLPHGVDLFFDLRREMPGFSPIMIFDVGAHVGVAVKQFAIWAPTASVYCFEPAESTFAKLVDTMRATPKTRCFHTAVGAAAGEAELVLDERSERNALVMAHAGAGPAAADVSTETVNVQTIDGICRDHGVEAISFLKIDTEGNDLAVLEGAEEMLRAQHIDLVQVEVGMTPANTWHVAFEQVKDHLEQRGYLLFGIYEQVPEWEQAHLRRSDCVFVSAPAAERYARSSTSQG